MRSILIVFVCFLLANTQPCFVFAGVDRSVTSIRANQEALFQQLVQHYSTLYSLMQTGSISAIRQQSSILLETLQNFPQQFLHTLQPSLTYLELMKNAKNYEEAYILFPFVYTPLFQLQCPLATPHNCSLFKIQHLFNTPPLDLPPHFVPPLFDFLQLYKKLSLAFFQADTNDIDSTAQQILQLLPSIQFPPIQSFLNTISAMTKTILQQKSLQQKLYTFHKFHNSISNFIALLKPIHF